MQRSKSQQHCKVNYEVGENDSAREWLLDRNNKVLRGDFNYDSQEEENNY